MKVFLEFYSDLKEFNNVTEAEKFLNSALYYCDQLLIQSNNFEDPIPYGKNTRLQPLMRDAKDFGCGWLFVTQIFN